MPYRIRSFTPADYPAMARIVSTVLAQTCTPEELRWEDGHAHAQAHKARWVAEVNGEAVACGGHSQSQSFYHPQKFEVSLMVLPPHRRQGIGGALFRQIEESLLAHDPISVTIDVNEAWSDGLRFAADRGFGETMRNWESHLVMSALNPASWQGLVSDADAKGYEIRSYASMADDPDRARKLYELVTEVRADVPTPDPWQEVSFEEWARVFDHQHFWPEGYFVGMKDGEWVGLSALWKSADAGVVTTGLTGVKRSHRGSGIAQAMKVRAITFAHEQGVQVIKTWNASNNVRMLSINDRLGFVRKPAVIFLRKHYDR